ncbi:MAG: tRNA (adenine(22)-N(1))-methyltransferase [Vibrio sp.]
MKLSQRLQRIAQWAETQTQQHAYDHIWDGCCDHGYLGADLLQRINSATIHFVDVVPHLIEQLTQRLKAHQTEATRHWQSHCVDMANLPLAHYAGRHLVIIAGVGGDLISQFIAQITRKHPNLDIDFIVCPVRHQYTLRQCLITHHFRLRREVLVEENRRHYEIISITKSDDHAVTAIHPVGCQIWHAASEEQHDIIKRYQRNTLAHYQRLQHSNEPEVDAIIRAYSDIEGL